MAAPLLLPQFALCFNCGLLGCPLASSSTPALPAQGASQNAFLFFFSQPHFKFKNFTRVLVHLALNNLNAIFGKSFFFLILSFCSKEVTQAEQAALQEMLCLFFCLLLNFSLQWLQSFSTPSPETEHYQLRFAYKKTWSNWEREPANETGFVYSNCRHVHSCFPTKGQNAAFTAVRG